MYVHVTNVMLVPVTYTCSIVLVHAYTHACMPHNYTLVFYFSPLGALLQYLRNRHDLIFKTDVILDMAVQICSAMQFLESIKFIHRDLVCMVTTVKCVSCYATCYRLLGTV